MGLAYLALGLGAGWLALLAFLPGMRLRVLSVQPYHFLEQIQASRPDMILVGNSWIFVNVDKGLLEKRLSAKMGRPIKVFFATEGGTSTAWWYLVLKNQVVKSGISGIPVGVFIAGTSFTDYNSNLNWRELYAIRKLMLPDEEIFSQKVGYRYRQLLSLSRFMPDRRMISQYILGCWTSAWLSWLPGRQDAKAALAGRFQLVEAYPFESLQAQAKPVEPVNAQACLRLSECAERTLMPDIIRLMARFHFFVVQIHKRPGGPPERPELAAYDAELARYLADKRITFISLKNRRELDDAGLFTDDYHLNHSGQSINTRIVADEIIRQRLLDGGSP